MTIDNTVWKSSFPPPTNAEGMMAISDEDKAEMSFAKFARKSIPTFPEIESSYEIVFEHLTTRHILDELTPTKQ